MATTMTSSDVVTILNALLRAEHGGIFRFIASSDPYITREAAAIRRPLQNITAAALRHEAELIDLIEALDGIPQAPAVTPEHQYLSFLSLEFLRPKLVEAAQRAIANYESALASISASSPDVANRLKNHLIDYRQFLDAIVPPASSAAPHS
ncbi:MAG TPA: hypothetical protein VHP11_07245 [Tepidisphaeraceae bacterium]|nr:hypothetical protein [Tepidisphaeraceae bacterium]